MSVVVRHGLLLSLALACCGCAQPLMGPWLTIRDKDTVRRRFEQFDPLPDETIAPDTMSRPPGFNLQRTRDRRADELRKIRGIYTLPNSGGPSFPTSREQYPNVVRQ